MKLITLLRLWNKFILSGLDERLFNTKVFNKFFNKNSIADKFDWVIVK